MEWKIGLFPIACDEAISVFPPRDFVLVWSWKKFPGSVRVTIDGPERGQMKITFGHRKWKDSYAYNICEALWTEEPRRGEHVEFWAGIIK